MNDTGLGRLLWAAASVVATIAVMIMLIVVITPPPVNTETPAEHWTRGTAADHNPWTTTWIHAAAPQREEVTRRAIEDVVELGKGRVASVSDVKDRGVHQQDGRQ